MEKLCHGFHKQRLAQDKMLANTNVVLNLQNNP